MDPASRAHQMVVETENLTKSFGPILANDNISFDVRQGEIHCLLGENGAGKTTLAECLYGFYQPDSGGIRFRGQRVKLGSPREAIRLGIGMVHQHFVLIRPFTVVENVLLAIQEGDLVLDLPKVEHSLAALCREYGVELDLNAQVWQLSVGEQQWVEILKALYLGVDLLILDEPTAVLTPQETQRLFAVLQKMRDEGLSIIMITHKLAEVMQVADRVSVLRKGRLVATVRAQDVTQVELARMMVGRDVLLQIQREQTAAGDPLLEVESLRTLNDRGQDALQDVSFTLRRGEVLGLAGVAGNGQRELFEVLVGVRKAYQGSVRFDGKEITNLSPRGIKSLGIAHVPDDRIREGLVSEFSVAENLILGQHRDRAFRRGLLLDARSIHQAAEQMITAFGIATPSQQQETRFLSGGNLQKLILARELSQHPRCLLANQPTRGLDVGVIEYVHHQLMERRKQGVAILLISEDLDELFALSDRIMVMYKGKVMDFLDPSVASPEQVGLLMAGVREGAG